jgi:pimeloyl-ACP methyl ester carboxylesterase
MCEQQEEYSQETSWDVDGIAVRATLELPVASGRHGGVVLIAGSGPTDRDWDSPLLPGTNGSGKLLAQALAHAGFVTLRYDKRASGPHAQENALRLMGKISMQSHVDEVDGAVATLASRSEVDTSRIYALTNSEGAIHALNYQLQATTHRFAGFVLTGVPGRSMADVMRSQVVPGLEALQNGKELVRTYDATVADIVAGKPIEPDEALPEGVRTLLAALITPANNPFARELLDVNPAQLLRDIQEPSLILIGKKDIQVDWKADGQPLEAALSGHKNVTFVYPENANHVLKYEPKDRAEIDAGEAIADYNVANRHLDPDALAAIRSWLAEMNSSELGRLDSP